MKNLFQTATLMVLIASPLFYACKKDKSCESCETSQTTLPTINTNKPPVASAGPDQTIALPADSIQLNGSASSDPEGKITRWQWTRISGPASFNIINANAALSQVTNLVEGVYQFELTVTDSRGLFDKDSTTVTVNKIYTNEKLFSDQLWQCWWGCWIDIPNPYTYLPAGSTFKVFIKRDSANTWEEAIYGSQTSNYGFLVDSSSLVVYMGMTTNLENDTPDIKIIY